MQRVRLYVFWLVALAVPFQAFAAAAMAFCGSEHGIVARAAPADSHDAHAMHAPAADDAHAGSGHASDDAAHKCGTCGACQATALTCTLELVAFEGLPRADLIEPPTVVATVAPRLLDRPPRA
jgi:hypothetical protein